MDKKAGCKKDGDEELFNNLDSFVVQNKRNHLPLSKVILLLIFSELYWSMRNYSVFHLLMSSKKEQWILGFFLIAEWIWTELKLDGRYKLLPKWWLLFVVRSTLTLFGTWTTIWGKDTDPPVTSDRGRAEFSCAADICQSNGAVCFLQNFESSFYDA